MGLPFDALSSRVIGCAIEVHRELGPGLLESTYQHCLAHELTLQRVEFAKETPLPVRYKGTLVDCGYRVDLLVEEKLLIELKSVAEVAPIHHAQILTYMKLAGVPVGLLINFNVQRLKDGIKRFVL
jgi:GxxExxY protein